MTSLSRLILVLIAVAASRAFAEDADFAPKIYATRADGSPAWELATLKDFASASSPELSPDGTRVAFDGWKQGESLSDRRIFIVNLNDGSIEDFGRGVLPNWSADGAWLAYTKYGTDTGVYTRPVFGGFEELIDVLGSGIQWSPDGKRLAYARDSNLIIYDLATKSKHAVFPENQPLPYQLIFWSCGWSPDSKYVCIEGVRAPVRNPVRQPTPFLQLNAKGYELAIVMADGEPQLKFCCSADDLAEDVAWHPGGKRIVIPKAGQLYELNPDTDDPPRLLPGVPAGRTNVGMCWSRDGEILVFISDWPRLVIEFEGIVIPELNLLIP